MRVYHIWNEHHGDLLARFFLRSLFEHNKGFLEPIGIKIEDLKIETKFATTEFKRITAEKAKVLRDICGSETEPFLFSDVDVQFFGSIENDIREALGWKMDMVFQKESDVHGVNTGFMLVRPGEKTSDFWGRVNSDLLSAENHRLNDQHIANRLLGRSGLEFRTFGPRIWAYSQGSPDRNMVVHHANCTTTLEAKIRQLNRIRRFMGLRLAEGNYIGG